MGEGLGSGARIIGQKIWPPWTLVSQFLHLWDGNLEQCLPLGLWWGFRSWWVESNCLIRTYHVPNTVGNAHTSFSPCPWNLSQRPASSSLFYGEGNWGPENLGNLPKGTRDLHPCPCVTWRPWFFSYPLSIPHGHLLNTYYVPAQWTWQCQSLIAYRQFQIVVKCHYELCNGDNNDDCSFRLGG